MSSRSVKSSKPTKFRFGPRNGQSYAQSVGPQAPSFVGTNIPSVDGTVEIFRTVLHGGSSHVSSAPPSPMPSNPIPANLESGTLSQRSVDPHLSFFDAIERDPELNELVDQALSSLKAGVSPRNLSLTCF